jgi:hypothetical protein
MIIEQNWQSRGRRFDPVQLHQGKIKGREEPLALSNKINLFSL